jgi:hypothetical protein
MLELDEDGSPATELPGSEVQPAVQQAAEGADPAAPEQFEETIERAPQAEAAFEQQFADTMEPPEQAPQSVPTEQDVTGEIGTRRFAQEDEVDLEIVDEPAVEVAEAIAERLEETADQLQAAALAMEQEIIDHVIQEPAVNQIDQTVESGQATGQTTAQAAEDAAFRKEFHLEAPDITKQVEITAPAQPEPDLASSPAAQSGGLLGLLGAQEIQNESSIDDSEAIAAEKDKKDALGQIFAKTEFAQPQQEDRGTISSQNDALRDLFSPKNEDAPVGKTDANGKTRPGRSEAPKIPDQAAAIARPVEQPIAVAVTSPPLNAAKSPAAAASDGVRGPAAHVDPNIAADSTGNALLSSILAKAGQPLDQEQCLCLIRRRLTFHHLVCLRNRENPS